MTIKDIRKEYGLTQKQMSDELGIPKRSIENWEGGVSSPPVYLVRLIDFYYKTFRSEQGNK